MPDLKISKLQVSNFRNLAMDPMEFGLGINCILGDNGHGKTNLLEALYVLGNRKSFRKNAAFPQFLSMDGDKCEIYFSSVFKDEENGKNINYSGKMNNIRDEWFLNGKTSSKKINARFVFINPFDFYSFHGIPKFRRDWFDQKMSQLSQGYKDSLSKYHQVLRIRNTLLQDRPKNLHSLLKAVQGEWVKYSWLLTQERKKFLQQLEQFFPFIFKKLFSQEPHLEILLQSKILSYSETDIDQFFKGQWEKDIQAGLTTYGVHKDDYMLLWDGLSTYDFSSLGQQKTGFLSLIFAYIELFRYKFNSYPIVLIDDVSGELDQNRWHRLIEYLEEGPFQVFITTANEGLRARLEKIERAKKIYINAGKITIRT